jgi:hypothetical protein
MNKRRLLKLAALLEADAKNKNGIKFDMCDWGTVKNPDATMSCGTSACAMGLAALSGVFKRAGLRGGVKSGAIHFYWHDYPVGGLYAAQKLFDIDRLTAMELFLPGDGRIYGAAAERAKAKQIRKLVAGRH